jgi:hypothetical protein
MRPILVTLLVSAFMATNAARIATVAAEPPQEMQPQAANHSRALQALLRLGQTAQQPVGIIFGDDSLCRYGVNLSATKDAFPGLIDRMLAQVPGYRWSLRDGVAIAQPNSLPPDAAKLLALTIPRYGAPRSTLVEHAGFLNMDIKAVLQPDEGTLGDILSSPDEAKTGPIELRDLTVEQILNHLVTQGKGGAWLLFPVPRDYRSAADAQFVQLVSYQDTTGRLERASCHP